MFKYWPKLVSRRERIPLWVLHRVFRASLRTQRFCALLFPCSSPVWEKWCAGTPWEGRSQLALRLGSCSSAAALPVPAGRSSLVQPCPRPRDSEHHWFATKLSVPAFPLWVYCHRDTHVLPSMFPSPRGSIDYSLLLDFVFVSRALWVIEVAERGPAKGCSLACSGSPFPGPCFMGRLM